jgi:hypothetical protein
VPDPTLQPVNQELILPPIYEAPGQVEQVPLENTDPGDGADSTSSFDKRYRDAFTGILYLGRLKDKMKKWGHTFDIETPPHLMRLEAGVLHKEYLNTLVTEQAWAALTVACYLRKVDGVSLPEPISADPRDTGLLEKYEWVLANLSQPVIVDIFQRCLVLDGQVHHVLSQLEAVGEANG